MAMLRADIEALEQNGITGMALARLGDPKVIPLWFGEGDLVTPGFVREAAKQALDEGYTFYANPRGRPELRAAIRAYLGRLYAVEVDIDRITVPGSSMLAITMASQMCLSSGDHGLIVTPHWPNIDRAFQVTGASFDTVRQRWSPAGWSLALDDLRDAVRPNTRALFVNSPCNPTGWVMRSEEQRALLEFCRERGIVIIADEVYHRMVYDGAEVAPSFLEIARDDDPLIVVNGFSKAFAMTGWRLGWMITPRRYATQMAVLAECFNTGAPSFVQRAGVAALEQGEEVVRALRAQYRAGRDTVMEILGPHAHLELVLPEGAFYAFPRIPGLASSRDFAAGVLAEEDVGLAPGYTFGPGSDEHFRLCFAQSPLRLREALTRIVRYLDRHGAAFAA